MDNTTDAPAQPSDNKPLSDVARDLFSPKNNDSLPLFTQLHQGLNLNTSRQLDSNQLLTQSPQLRHLLEDTFNAMLEIRYGSQPPLAALYEANKLKPVFEEVNGIARLVPPLNSLGKDFVLPPASEIPRLVKQFNDRFGQDELSPVYPSGLQNNVRKGNLPNRNGSQTPGPNDRVLGPGPSDRVVGPVNDPNDRPAPTDKGTYNRPSGRTVDGYIASQHPDLNLDIRGFSRTNAGKGLIDMGGDEDPKAPQLASMFGRDHGMPNIVNTYAVNDWNWNTMTRGPALTNYEVTMVGFETRPGERLLVPNSGYRIDGQGHQGKILFADSNSITINYTAEGTVGPGYTVHIEGINVDPNLKQGDSVRGAQMLGTAQGKEVQVSIRDTGTFMDPRVKKDWWRDLSQP